MLLLNSCNEPSPYVLNEVQSIGSPKTMINGSVNTTISKKRQLGARPSVRFGGISEVWYDSSFSSNSCSSLDDHRDDDNHNLDCDDDDDFSLWYTNEDFDRFKRVFVADAKHALQRERLQGNIKSNTNTNGRRSIRRVYEAIMDSCASLSTSSSSSSSTSYDSKSLELLLQELNLPLQDHQKLEANVVGLESLMSRSIHRDKMKHRHLLLHDVEEIQLNDQKMSIELQAAVLRVCESISDPAKKFALYLGMSSSVSQ